MKPRRYANISKRTAVRPTATAPAAKSSARKSISPRSLSPAMPSRLSWRARSRPWKRLHLHLRRQLHPRLSSTSPVHPGRLLLSFPSARRAWSPRSRSPCALKSRPLRCPSLRSLPPRRLPRRLRKLPLRPRLLSRPRSLPPHRKLPCRRLQWLPNPRLCRLIPRPPRPFPAIHRPRSLPLRRQSPPRLWLPRPPSLPATSHHSLGLPVRRRLANRPRRQFAA